MERAPYARAPQAQEKAGHHQTLEDTLQREKYSTLTLKKKQAGHHLTQEDTVPQGAGHHQTLEDTVQREKYPIDAQSAAPASAHPLRVGVSSADLPLEFINMPRDFWIRQDAVLELFS